LSSRRRRVVNSAFARAAVLGIADLVSARHRLEQAGVSFDGPNDVVEGMVQTATFFDPDGNALMLAEDLTGVA